MKKLILFALITLSCFTSKLYAQANTEERQEITDPNFSTVKNLIKELADGINPKSFMRDWRKDNSEWNKKRESAKNATELGAQLVLMAKSVKESAFKPEWEKNREKWYKQVLNARNGLALAGLMKSFHNYLEEDAFAPAFKASRQEWLNSISNLQ